MATILPIMTARVCRKIREKAAEQHLRCGGELGAVIDHNMQQQRRR